MSEDKYLGKIKKLLNLAKSSNSNEAASALSKAQALMRKHDLNLDDVMLSNISSTHSVIHGVRAPAWVLNLLSVIRQAFGVRSLIGRKINNYSVRDFGEIEFVGRSPNDEIASYCFDILYAQLVKDRKRFIAGLHKNCKPVTKRNRADWYCMGWVSEVEDKVHRLVMPVEDKNAIDRWVDNKYGELTTYSARENVEDKAAGQAFHSGRKDGAGISLYSGVDGAQQKQIGTA